MIYIPSKYLHPQLYYKGTFFQIDDLKIKSQLEALKNMWENGLKKAAFALFHLIESRSEEKIQEFESQRQIWINKDKWKEMRQITSDITDDYLMQFGFEYESEMPFANKMELAFLIQDLEQKMGDINRTYMHGMQFFYAESYIMHLHEVYMAWKTMNNYREALIDFELFKVQINEIEVLVSTKDVRDSLAHKEDRGRQLDKKGQTIIGDPDSGRIGIFTEDSDTPFSIFFSGCFNGEYYTFTNHKGKHSSVLISIAQFNLIEKQVQKMVENLNLIPGFFSGNLMSL